MVFNCFHLTAFSPIPMVYSEHGIEHRKNILEGLFFKKISFFISFHPQVCFIGINVISKCPFSSTKVMILIQLKLLLWLSSENISFLNVWPVYIYIFSKKLYLVLSIYLSSYLSIYLSVYLSIYLSIYLYIYIYHIIICIYIIYNYIIYNI